VANSYHPLAYKSIRGARRVQMLLRDEEAKNQVIKTVTLDDVGADPLKCGLKGSPTIVAKTDKVAEIGGSCVVRQGEPIEAMVRDVLQNTNLREFVSV
jgi:electron transfer flavoprotein beta subunit